MPTPVFSKKANPPGGHYSQAMIHGDMMFISGQLGFPIHGERVVGTVEEQTRNCLENIRLILEEVGADFTNIIKTTVYVSDMESWAIVNSVYSSVFGTHKPARAIVPCGPLHYNCAVEIEAIAAI